MSEIDANERDSPRVEDPSTSDSSSPADLEQSLDAAVGMETRQDASLHTSLPGTDFDRGLEQRRDGAGENSAPEQVVAEETDLENALDDAVGDSSADQPMAARLVVLGGLDVGQIHPLGPDAVVLGRSPSADLRIQSHAVSSEHARIELIGNRYRIVDLSSTNGTWVNGQRVAGSRDLRSGDTITIADTDLRFLGPEAEDASHTAMMLNPPLLTATSSQAIVPYGDSSWRFDAAADEDRPVPFEERVRRIAKVAAIARRYWPLLVLLPTLAAAIGVISGFLSPPPSEASFDMGITPNAPDPTQRFEQYNQHFFASAERAFTTRTLIRKTLESLGEVNPPSERISLVETRLKFKSIGLGLYRGSFTDARSDLAVRFLEQHATNYLKGEVDKTIKVIQQEVDFLTGQVKDKEEELRNTERKLRDFKEENLSGMPEQVQGMMQSAAALEPRRGELAAQVTRLSQELDLAKTRLHRGSPLVEKKALAAQPYEAALTDAKRQLSDARASGLGDDHPTVKRLKSNVDQLERLAQQTASGSTTDLERQANADYTRLKDRVRELEAELAGARTELGAIGGHIGKVDQLAKKMPEIEAEYAQLSRSYEANTTLYRQLFERLRQAQVRLELERNNAAARYDVIVPPHSEGANLSKSIKTRAGLGGFAGLAVALLVAAGRELWRRVRGILRRSPSEPSTAITVNGRNVAG